MLITPGGVHFSHIHPNTLVKTSDNITGDIIHQAIYEARSDVQSIVHLHTPASVAISSLKEGFMPIAQESAYFYKKVSYYDWVGMSTDSKEKVWLREAAKGDSRILVLRNHGFCALGATVAEAWVLAYYFDRSCQTQLNVLQTGRPINIPDHTAMVQTFDGYKLPGFTPGSE